MAITILSPTPAVINHHPESSDDDFDHDEEGDVAMVGEERTSKRIRASGKDMVTPGEVVTDDPQWMRHVDCIIKCHNEVSTD